MLVNDGATERIAFWLWLIAGLAWAIRFNLKHGAIPKREHLRDQNGPLYGAVWNFFSRDKWTDEGVALHEERLFQLAAFLIVWLGSYFLLEWIF